MRNENSLGGDDAELEMRLGHREAGEAADREVAALVEPGTYPHWLAVVGLAIHAIHRGDTEEAVRLGRRALEEAASLDDRSRVNALGNLASILTEAGQTGEARLVLERFVHEARRSGLTVCETVALIDRCRLELLERYYESDYNDDYVGGSSHYLDEDELRDMNLER
jgi:ATP/maltotriose-dependent transcriptional regulator MalT